VATGPHVALNLGAGDQMKRSSNRILTTHTGSLPRPRELTRLYSLRARGDAVDEAEIDRAGREAVRTIIA